jgi:pimeloyl-ACP methyl ester carboxylesterase
MSTSELTERDEVFPAASASPTVATTATTVLIHGLDSAKDTWSQVLADLARDRYPALAVDLRGHGESPLYPAAKSHEQSQHQHQHPHQHQHQHRQQPDGTQRRDADGDDSTFSTAALAADVRRSLWERGVRGRVVLVGHSMGGRVAMRYAADYPAGVAALVIEDMDLRPRSVPVSAAQPLCLLASPWPWCLRRAPCVALHASRSLSPLRCFHCLRYFCCSLAVRGAIATVPPPPSPPHTHKTQQ